METLRAQPNTTVDILDLYQHQSTIPFYVSDRTVLEKNSFYQENKERFMAADRLLIVFPVYWYSTPGILKCWFDLINQFAWKFNGKYRPALPLHKIKKALVINLTLLTRWYNRFILGDPARDQVKKTLQFISIKPEMYTVDRSTSLTERQLEKHLAHVKKECQNLIR